MADEYTQEVRRHDPHGYMRHAIGGAGLGLGVAVFLLAKQSAQPVTAAVSGIAFASLAGVLVELWDVLTGRGVMDWRDAAFTALGGLAAFLVLFFR